MDAGQRAASPPRPAHPIGLVVTDDLRRSRLTVFFRLLLVIPHVIWLSSGHRRRVRVLISLVRGALHRPRARRPPRLHRRLPRYSTRVYGYLFLLADPCPPFGGVGAYPIDARIDAAGGQSRLTVFFRLCSRSPR